MSQSHDLHDSSSATATSDSAAHAWGRKSFLLPLLLLIPLIAGAVFALSTGADPARSWSQSAEEQSGAPVAVSPDGVKPEDLTNARRAAGEASSQAGFLVTGTGELVNGSKQLVDGTGELKNGTTQAVDGAAKLNQGMIELQAGTGQLGNGAVQVADGIQQAVDQINGLGGVQGQLLAAIDDTDKKLEASPDPQAAQMRKDLAGLRQQVATFQVDPNTANQLNQLKQGSRDIANQLAVPGYAYHDGIYSATKGSKDLLTGLRELDGGVNQLNTGAGDLTKGAEKVDGMSKANKDKIGNVQRALPVVQAASVTEGGETERTTTFVPMFGFLIAALILIGSSLIALFGRNLSARTLAATCAGMAALGALLLFMLIDGLTPQAGLGFVAVALLAAAVGALATKAIVKFFGFNAALWITFVGLLAQIGIVGWVWKSAASAAVAPWQTAASALMPLHYPTVALSSLGNGAAGTSLWMSLAVMTVLVAIAAFVLRPAPVVAPVAAEDHTDFEEAQDE